MVDLPMDMTVTMPVTGRWGNDCDCTESICVKKTVSITGVICDMWNCPLIWSELVLFDVLTVYTRHFSLFGHIVRMPDKYRCQEDLSSFIFEELEETTGTSLYNVA